MINTGGMHLAPGVGSINQMGQSEREPISICSKYLSFYIEIMVNIEFNGQSCNLASYWYLRCNISENVVDIKIILKNLIHLQLALDKSI